MISPYHPELYTWLRVVKIRLAQVVNFRLTFRPTFTHFSPKHF